MTDPLLVFPTSSCSPPSAARFLLSFRPDPCPQNRIGEGSLRSGEGSGGGGGVRGSPAPRWSEVRSGSHRSSLHFGLWTAAFCRCLARRVVSRNRSCFCFDRLSGRLEWARARGMPCRFPGLDACRARCQSSRTKPLSLFFSFSPLLPRRFQIPIIWGAPIVVACLWNLESSNR